MRNLHRLARDDEKGSPEATQMEFCGGSIHIEIFYETIVNQRVRHMNIFCAGRVSFEARFVVSKANFAIEIRVCNKRRNTEFSHRTFLEAHGSERHNDPRGRDVCGSVS